MSVSVLLTCERGAELGRASLKCLFHPENGVRRDTGKERIFR
jgi:hypothetical protein